ncbi:MAG: hypothetical protein ABDH91_04995 [Bacteroidia bacterium]
MRFSFLPSSYAKERPKTLGRGLAQILKDYNVQTYWLCFFHKKLLVGLTIGHGVPGLLGGYHQELPSVQKARK